MGLGLIGVSGEGHKVLFYLTFSPPVRLFYLLHGVLNEPIQQPRRWPAISLPVECFIALSSTPLAPALFSIVDKVTVRCSFCVQI